MDALPPTPTKPGWYWDPSELEFNLALRETWRREFLFLGPENSYRLRRWDGRAWTDQTLRNRVLRGTTGFPHFAGPTTRLYPVTPEQSRRGWKIWIVAMALGAVAAVVSRVVK